jgi:hypothetical protein
MIVQIKRRIRRTRILRNSESTAIGFISYTKLKILSWSESPQKVSKASADATRLSILMLSAPGKRSCAVILQAFRNHAGYPITSS